MTLTQLASSSPTIYQGSGSVTRISSGQLELKSLCSRNVSYSSSDRGVGIGKLVPETSYFSLNATDDQGRVWTSERFLIDKLLIDKRVQGNQVTITAQLYKISHTAQALPDENASLRLQLSEFIGIPFRPGETDQGEPEIVNYVNLQACGYEFILRYERDSTLIEVTSNSSDLPAFIETRVCEALQFVVGVSISWFTLELNQGQQKTTTIQSPFNINININSRDKQTIVLSPIRLNSADTNEDVWNLFGKYVCHILTYSKEEFHPISGWVRRIINARTTIVETRMLTLSVAIEGLLRIGFYKKGLMDDEIKTVKIQVLDVLDKVKELGLEKKLNDRITGFLKNIKEKDPVRPIDKLYKLSKEGWLDEDLIKSWDDIRNTSTHGGTIERKEIEKYSILCDQVNVLFNHLVFLLIGYTGKYTDYRKEGWITGDFNSLIDKSN